jgi:hypothetical protein
VREAKLQPGKQANKAKVVAGGSGWDRTRTRPRARARARARARTTNQRRSH